MSGGVSHPLVVREEISGEALDVPTGLLERLEPGECLLGAQRPVARRIVDDCVKGVEEVDVVRCATGEDVTIVVGEGCAEAGAGGARVGGGLITRILRLVRS